MMRHTLTSVVALGVSLGNAMAADVLHCITEQRYEQHNADRFFYERAVGKPQDIPHDSSCRDAYMGTCGAHPDGKVWDLPVNALTTTGSQYQLTENWPDGKQDGETTWLPTRVDVLINRTDAAFSLKIIKFNPVGPGSDKVRVLNGDIDSIVEYSGHCTLQHVETKF
jgi:hypothetical protein